MPRKYSGPLQPGRRSAYVPGSRTNRPRKYSVASLNKKIKTISLKQSETKTAAQASGATDGATVPSLYHNVTLYYDNLLASGQGITANPGMNDYTNRIGNEVIGRGIMLRIQYIADPDHQNINLRGYVFQYESNITPDDSTFWCGPSGIGANMNRMLDSPDKREINILKRFSVQNTIPKLNGVGSTQTYVSNVYRNIWIPLKDKKIKYTTNNGSTPKYKDIGFCITGFDANNTSQSDIIGYLSWTSKFYYKDP